MTEYSHFFYKKVNLLTLTGGGIIVLLYRKIGMIY